MVAKLTFGRERRLRRRSDFVRIQSTGLRVTTAHFVLLLSLHPGLSDNEPGAHETMPLSRLGLVVSRKAGHAVGRARIKRLCRECFRTWPGLLPAGVDVVVIARVGASELELRDVRREWRAAEHQISKRAVEVLAQAKSAPHVAATKRR
jgi:ribonuclease P protein component